MLADAGYRCTIRPVSIDERTRRGESAVATARRLARDKALACARRPGPPASPGTIILAADTIVAVGRTFLGKPVDADDARRMLGLLSGRTHRVLTGVALCGPRGRSLRTVHALTRVTFRRIRRTEIDWYVSTDEPYDKAGAYGIQGRAALFITGIHGSWTNVVGLPMELLPSLIGLPARGSRAGS